MVPINSEYAGGLSHTPNSPDRLHNESRGPKTSDLAHLQESFSSQGISSEASDLLMAL